MSASVSSDLAVAMLGEALIREAPPMASVAAASAVLVMEICRAVDGIETRRLALEAVIEGLRRTLAEVRA